MVQLAGRDNTRSRPRVTLSTERKMPGGRIHHLTFRTSLLLGLGDPHRGISLLDLIVRRMERDDTRSSLIAASGAGLARPDPSRSRP